MRKSLILASLAVVTASAWGMNNPLSAKENKAVDGKVLWSVLQDENLDKNNKIRSVGEILRSENSKNLLSSTDEEGNTPFFVGGKERRNGITKVYHEISRQFV